jgi:hypothetical protein
VHARQARKQSGHFGSGQHNRQPSRPSGLHDSVQPLEFDAQHFAIQEKHARFRLILGGGGNLQLDREMRKERLHLPRTQLHRMALAMKMDEASNPVRVRLLGSDAVMLATNGVANLVEQARPAKCVVIQFWLGLVAATHASALILREPSSNSALTKWMTRQFAR